MLIKLNNDDILKYLGMYVNFISLFPFCNFTPKNAPFIFIISVFFPLIVALHPESNGIFLKLLFVFEVF